MENTTIKNIVAAPNSVRPLNGDIVETASTLTNAEVRYLVGAYYELREKRTGAGNRTRSTGTSASHAVLDWLSGQSETLESQIERALDSWTNKIPAAVWAKGIVGVGPVISAGLAAHIDIRQCPTVGRIWRFAGLDPTVQWHPNTRRPWNAALKFLCGKIGESFVRVAGSDGDFYGKLYRQRRAAEQQRNEAGQFAGQARAQSDRSDASKNVEDQRWYSAGKLPPAHINNRAKRWAVKLFLAHYHHVAWKLATGEEPPKPYVIAHLDHADYITPPNFDPASEGSNGRA